MIRSAGTCAAVLLAIGLIAGGCAKKKPAPPEVAATPAPPTTTTPAPPPAPPPPAPAPAPKPLTEEEIFERTTLEELNQKRPLADVFFAYDSVDLSEQARASLQKNSEWMKRWSSTRVSVEGHADSRGTNEYNLALGDRRAAAVRNYLVSLGIAAARVTIVSKGEEEPTCPDENESCWQQNRRGHFIITAK